MDSISEQESPEEKAVRILRDFLRLLGLSAGVRAEPDGADRLVLHLETDETGRLVGRRGMYLESLELLLNRALRRSGAKSPRVTLRVPGYERRETGDHRRPSVDEERLKGMALDRAKEVRRWGESAEIGPFTSRERRVIHMTLRDDPEVETRSGPDEGGGRKKIVIAPVDR